MYKNTVSNTALAYALAALGNKGSGTGGGVIMPTINVGKTETLTPGKKAYVNNVGGETAAILDFGIPRGSMWQFTWGVNHENGDPLPDGVFPGDFVLDQQGKIFIAQDVLVYTGIQLSGKGEDQEMTVYEYAVAGGYKGTEIEFKKSLSNIDKCNVDYLPLTGGRVEAGNNYLEINESGIHIGNSATADKSMNIDDEKIYFTGKTEIDRVDCGEIA